jgi:DNA sulfur modification protein DndB
MNAKPFIGLTEFERSTISVRSSKIFTLSGIKQATRALFGKGPKDGFSDVEQKQAVDFWNKLNQHMLEWQQVQAKTLSSAEFRQEFITAHGIGLQALAIVGKEISELNPAAQADKFEGLKGINWLKSNVAWSNRAMQHGRLSKATSNIFLTAIEIKRQIALPISEEELIKEKELLNA